MRRRVLFVGWDSADWQIIQPLVDAGKMPVLQRMIETGVSGRLASLEPMVSPLLWTSIVTGKRAYAHGIYSFTATDPVSGTVESAGSHHRTCHALWNILHNQGRRSVVCNWFASHPAEPVNGLVISNEFAVQSTGVSLPENWQRESVSPPMHWEALRESLVAPEVIDGSLIKLLVPRADEVDQQSDTRLARLAALLAENFSVHSAFTYGLQKVEWDFAAVYYEAIDLVAHYFMRYVAPAMAGVSRTDAEIYGLVVEGIYRLHDAMLGRLLDLAGPETTTLIVSDHGFHSREGRPGELPDVPLALTRWHRRQGVLVMHGPGLRCDELLYGAGLLDIAPTVLSLFDIPVGEDMEGRVLAEAFESRPLGTTIPTWEGIEGDFARSRSGTKAQHSNHLLQRFVDLGYLAPTSPRQPEQTSSHYQTERFFRAISLMEGQRVAEALPILDELHELEPERDDVAQSLATVLLRCGLLDEAAEVIDLLENTTDLPSAAQLRADLEWQRGDRDACREALARAEKMAGDSVQSLNLAGALYVQLRQIPAAEAAFVRSLTVEKENPSALSGLSYCRSLQGRYEEAAELALEGISLLFHHFYSHYCYGIALAHLGREQEATRAFENTLRFQPRFHRARHYLIYLLKGRPAAKALVEMHRSVLLQRSVDAIRQDSSRRALRDQVRRGRAERAADRALRRRATIERTAEPTLDFLIVSGLPRSGTSLVMQMLKVGGIPIMSDGVRCADEDNPHGYYEWERIKELPSDPGIMTAAAGRAVKVVSPLLPSLPRRHRYRVILLRRNLGSTIVSQNRMRLRLKGVPPEDAKLTEQQLTAHLEQTCRLLEAAPNVEWIEIEFEKLVARSASEIGRLAAFARIDPVHISAMQAAVK